MLWINASFMLTALHLGFTTHNVVAYDLTGNNSSVGVIAFCIGAAILIATPFAGTVADRMSEAIAAVHDPVFDPDYGAGAGGAAVHRLG